MTFDGLSKADSAAVELVPGPFTGRPDPSTYVKTVQVLAGSPLAKFSVISADPNADFDMYVMTPAGPLTVATSSASESVSIPNPTPGKYTVYANLFNSPNKQATKASVDAAVLGVVAGKATLSPNPLRLANGKAGKVTLNVVGTGGRLLHRTRYLRRCQRPDVRLRSGVACRGRRGTAHVGGPGQQ